MVEVVTRIPARDRKPEAAQQTTNDINQTSRPYSLSSPVSGSCVSASSKGRERTVPGSRYRMSSVPSPHQ